MNSVNISQNNNSNLEKTSDDNTNKPEYDEDKKIKMLDSFEMEENEGQGGDQCQQLQGRHQESQGISPDNDHMLNVPGNQTHHQQQLVTGIASSGLLDQAAQQILAASLNQQPHQQLNQLAHHPSLLDTSALSVQPHQKLGHLAQAPNTLSAGSLNLFAVHNGWTQQQQHTAAQTNALIGGGLIAPNTEQYNQAVPALVNNIIANGIGFGQQHQIQQQHQNQQLAGSLASSIASLNSAYASTCAINAQPNTALSPTNQAITTATSMQSHFPSVPFTAPSILGPSQHSLLTAIHRPTLSPQLTIPHYIPPTPASWGAPLPTLTVQDRPLVTPIYNGINPNYPRAQMLHSHPPIFCVHEFLTPAECDFLIEAASDAFGPAPVVGKGQGEISQSRTSSTCYLAREDLPEYLRKVSLLTGKPAEHCELPQVGRYLPSQQYLQHFDAFDLSNEDGRRFASNGGQRTITVLTYLNDVALGGATAFPNLNLQVQPRRGMALVFFPSTLDGLLDKMALHAALPAVDIKYVSQVWIRQTNYDGRPSKRLEKPMVAGLQEQREREELEKSLHAQILMGQFGLHQASVDHHHHQQQQHQQRQNQEN